MLATYGWALSGLWLIVATVFVQGFVAAMAHARSDNAVPGKMDDDLGHESFEFRAHRTFHNSLENLPAFAFPVILAMLIDVDAGLLAALVWVYALARLLHMVLYYAIATNQNPSPRSYFYLIGWLATATLFAVTGWQLIG